MNKEYFDILDENGNKTGKTKWPSRQTWVLSGGGKGVTTHGFGNEKTGASGNEAG